jgi:hypothetical protein
MSSSTVPCRGQVIEVEGVENIHSGSHARAEGLQRRMHGQVAENFQRDRDLVHGWLEFSKRQDNALFLDSLPQLPPAQEASASFNTTACASTEQCASTATSPSAHDSGVTAPKDDHEASQRNTAIITLHACGDLSPTTIRAFVDSKVASLLLNVGCCYHKLSLAQCASCQDPYQQDVEAINPLEDDQVDCIPTSSSNNSENCVVSSLPFRNHCQHRQSEVAFPLSAAAKACVTPQTSDLINIRALRQATQHAAQKSALEVYFSCTLERWLCFS